jgi:hypothetical protein
MRKGYLLAEAMIAVVITGVVVGVFTTMNYYTTIQSNLLKQQNTKIILEVVRSRLVNLATDPDSDQYFELLKQDANNTLPTNIGLGTDAWGKRINYTTYDFGVANTVDANYSDTNTTISPNANIAGRLVSSGENLTLDTNASDSTAQVDDIMLEVGVGELNHYKLYGGSEITTKTRAYNSAIISDVAPTNPLDGTLWYDINNTTSYIYNESNTSWILY